jgi:MFS family permease
MQHIFDRILFGHVRWRHVNIDELSEMYVSMLLRSLAMSLIGVFVPLFMLKNGYSVIQIFAFYIAYFGIRIFADIASAFLVAKIGPKHTIMVSYIVQILASASFLSLPIYNWPILLPAFLWGTSASIFNAGFHVDFSKIKHSSSSGKEFGRVSIAERFGGALGPFIGGGIAYLWGGQSIFFIAIIILLLGLIPLFWTAEPVKTNQHISFRELPFKALKHDYVSFLGMLINFHAHTSLWPVYLAVFILSDKGYIELGALTSLGIVVSIVAAYVIGNLVDNKKGRLLLNVSAVVSAVLYGFTPFVSTLAMAVLINLISEISLAGIKIPFHKGVYDRADSLPGQRIAYISSLETTSSAFKFLFWSGLFAVAYYLGSTTALTAGFFITAVGSLLITFQNFPALRGDDK